VSEGPDLDTKSFTLRDLRQAMREGREQGIKDALMLIEAGATVARVREGLLDGIATDPL
jgi:hypothetical protein